MTPFPTRASLALTLVCLLGPPFQAPASAQTPAPPPAPPANELDAFMEKVLKRRDLNRQILEQYVLDETEQFDALGPSRMPIYRHKREYTWYVRDGLHVRSPVRFNGVAVGEEARKEYEDSWARRERARLARRAEAEKKTPEAAAPPPPEPIDDPAVAGASPIPTPRFVSEAYFMDFKFEPGNYYLAGREQLEGQPVLKIEYYPTRLFNDEETSKGSGKEGARGRREREAEDRIERQMNKTALVTLWVDPTEHQIVKYTFDNVWMDFLPAAWLVRIDDIRASMTMGQPFAGVWLPREISVHAGVTVASGSLEATYGRQFSNYKQADVKTRIRIPKTPISIPETRMLVPETWIHVHETRIRIHETRIPVPEMRIPVHETRIPVPEMRIPVPEARIPVPETRIPVPEARIPVPETRIPVPEARIHIHETWIRVPEEETPHDNAGPCCQDDRGRGPMAAESEDVDDDEPGLCCASDDRQAPVETVTEIRVHGNAFVRDSEVVRLSGLTIGQPLPADGVAGIERRLEASGVFESVEVRKRFRSLDSASDVAIILLVHERPGHRSELADERPSMWSRVKSRVMFLPIIDYHDGYGFTFGGRTSTIDLLGAGERLSVPLTWGGTRRAAIELDRTFSRGPITRVESTFGISQSENPHFEIDDRRVTWTARAERSIARLVRAGVDTSQSTVDFGGLDDRLWTVGADVRLDTRGDPGFPRNAVLLGVAWNALHVRGADQPINRYTTDARGYLGLIRQAVLAGRVQYSTADRPVPSYERVLLGGAANLRGFRAGAYDGDRLFATTAELRVPLTSVLSGAKLGVSAFMDAAKVLEVGQRFDDAPWRQGVGAGVFLIATIVRLNLDVAHGLKDGDTRVHLAMGFGF